MISLLLKEKKKNSTFQRAINSKKLSIQFSLDGFSFCISDRQSKSTKISSHCFARTDRSPKLILDRLQAIFEQEKSLHDDFESVTLVHQNHLNTLVPNAFFNENYLNDYLKFSVKTMKTDLIVFDALDFMDCKNIYIPYVNINNFLFLNFGEFEYKHHISVLLEKLMGISDSKLYFYVNVSPSTFDIVVIKDKKLLFFNVFEYQTKEDFIYYTLFTLEQLQLSARNTQLILLGEIEKNSNLSKSLCKYVKNIDFLDLKKPVLDHERDISMLSNFILQG